jgi:hypothetical protein
MPWTLEIHHLDISSAGDATIVRATDGTAQNTKIVLIDGGKTNAGAVIRAYCNAQNFAHIDVVLVTHFDKDHYYGVTWLLNNTNLLDNAHIYDAGKLPNERLFKQSKDRENTKRVRKDSDYKKYLDAIAAEVGVRHATKLVNSFDIAHYDTGNGNVVTIPRPAVVGHLAPDWLIDKELMWGNGLDGMGGRGAFASVVPVGGPTITCIAANKYVRQHGGGVRFVSTTNIYNGPNVMSPGRIADEENKNDNLKSLGFIIRFNNFKYYVAGDLEWVQEDGHNNVNQLPVPVFQPGVKAYVNNANNMANRVLAMKTSHHGSETASTYAFIRQMRPLAAFISTGVGNQFKHPAQRTVNVLDGYPEVPVLSRPVNHLRHPQSPPLPPTRPVKYYLTGYQSLVPLLTYGGDSSETAGVPHRATPGHIRLEVSQLQSQRSAVGQIFRGIRAAADRTAQAAGVGGLALDAIADAGATLGIAYAVAAAIGAPAAAATEALRGVALAGNDLTDLMAPRDGIITVAFAAAGGGKANAAAAASNIEAGARVANIGAGAAEAIGAAVTGQNAVTVSGDAQGAGATANEGNAAGAAAAAVLHVMNNGGALGADDAAYAACAAIRAVKGGASVSEAVAIALSIAATLGANHTTAAITATMVTTAARAAGMAQGLSAVAGAVASASWWAGVPAEVNTATATALTAAGFVGVGVAAAGVGAQNDATIAAADLFNVHFTYDDVGNNQNANANVAHS